MKRDNKPLQQGFTLLELLSVIVAVGVLAAIASPVWFGFLARQQTTSVQGQLRQKVQEAQSKSQQRNILWQFSVRESGDVVEIATHPATVNPADAIWEPIDNAVVLDSETTLLRKDGIYYVRFDHNGNVRGSRLGRITVSSRQFPEIKRCVIVSTLIGATRKAKEQPSPDPSYRTRDRYCY